KSEEREAQGHEKIPPGQPGGHGGGEELQGEVPVFHSVEQAEAQQSTQGGHALLGGFELVLPGLVSALALVIEALQRQAAAPGHGGHGQQPYHGPASAG